MAGTEKNPPISIKVEPGSSYKRLPSFRTPRDLKLTEFQKIGPHSAGEGKSKKVYVPNLNIQRKKPTEDSSKVQNENSKTNDKFNSKHDEKGKKEKGRKKQANYIQSTGVFSEGLAPSIKTGRWSNRYSDSSSSNMLMKPKLKEPEKINKEEEAAVMKELLKDDFIDDPSFMPDLKQCPVKLPLKDFEGEIFAKKEEDEKSMLNRKIKKDITEYKVKTEPGLEFDEVTKPRKIAEMAPLTFQELLSASLDQSYIFFQLPHMMPKQKTFLPTGSKLPAKTSQPQPAEAEESTVLRKLPAGKVGKLQILKSGRARLVLGDVNFLVEAGTQPAFKQDLIAVDLNPSSLNGDMINLGSITTRMIVSPDWNQLLAN